VYVIQGIWLGLAGAAGGVLFGFAAVKAAPLVLQKILPVEVETHLSVAVAAEALVFGFVLCFSFALLPLLCVRRVPAMAAVRAPVAGGVSLWRDPLTWLVLPAVTGSLVWLATTLSPKDDKDLGLWFCAALAVGVLVLGGVARLIMMVTRRVVRPWWPFTIRQGLAGLYRPRNQTQLFLLSVGTGVSLVLSTLLTQSMLTDYLRSGQIGMKENFFVIDLKPEQRAKLTEVLRAGGAEIVSEAPVARLSLTKVNGRTAEQLQSRKARNEQNEPVRVAGWVFTQAYRVSWNPALPESPAGAPLKVSVERGLARSLRIEVGGRLTFTGDGGDVECEVIELHEISWDRMLDNFPVVIKEHSPHGLTAAWATGAHVMDSAHGARMQREVSQALPGITVLDVTSFTAVLADIMERGRWLVQSMSLLTVVTGLIIVVAVLLAGRRDRVEESVLLRTLGASRFQIRRILVWEYLLLGLFAALTGALLSVGFAWLLAVRVFHLPFDTWYWPLGVAVALVCALTAALGMALSRGVAGHPPLAILRGEG
jgi:putative ABC transport system permease protein